MTSIFKYLDKLRVHIRYIKFFFGYILFSSKEREPQETHFSFIIIYEAKIYLRLSKKELEYRELLLREIRHQVKYHLSKPSKKKLEYQQTIRDIREIRKSLMKRAISSHL